jgi:hypothetical protein
MDRKQIIKTIIELHNFFIIEWKKHRGFEVEKDDLWDINLLEVKPDRYYLVEELSVEHWDSEKDTKTFKPKTEVRYLLRSGEAAKYGKSHNAYYKRYLSTVPIDNEYLENPQAYKESLLKDFEEMKKKDELKK